MCVDNLETGWSKVPGWVHPERSHLGPKVGWCQGNWHLPAQCHAVPTPGLCLLGPGGGGMWMKTAGETLADRMVGRQPSRGTILGNGVFEDLGWCQCQHPLIRRALEQEANPELDGWGRPRKSQGIGLIGGCMAGYEKCWRSVCLPLGRSYFRFKSLECHIHAHWLLPVQEK